MSENDIENETQSAMDQMLDAIQQQNLSQSRAHFDMLMQDKISDALEAEKVNVAASIYSQPQEDEDDLDLDVDAELDDEYEEESDDIEQDVESAFEESDLEQELADIDEVEV